MDGADLYRVNMVEEPLRLRSRPRAEAEGATVSRRVAGVAVVALGAGVVAAAGGWLTAVAWINPPHAVGALDPRLYPGAEALASGVAVPQARMRPTVFEAPGELPPPTVDGCIADWDTREVITCTYGVPDAERTLAVVGSSHAEHWLPALQVLAVEHSFRIQVYLTDVNDAVTALATHVQPSVGNLLDLQRVHLAGYSAGGHLAAWVAGRRAVGSGKASQRPEIHLRSVTLMAAVLDLEFAVTNGRDGFVRKLLGGSPSEVPDRYDFASPIAHLPTGLRVTRARRHRPRGSPRAEPPLHQRSGSRRQCRRTACAARHRPRRFHRCHFTGLGHRPNRDPRPRRVPTLSRGSQSEPTLDCADTSLIIELVSWLVAHLGGCRAIDGTASVCVSGCLYGIF
ncbi:hypothetical protein ACW9HJ_34565 [Nocardia gipuzkoensis]